MTTCTACRDNEVWTEAAEHGHQLCESCATTEDCECTHSYRGCENVVHFVWETDRDSAWCGSCRERERIAEEKVTLETNVETIAGELGWRVARWQIADTGSVYMTLRRGEEEELKVRVSDHASAYHREDVSLTVSGEDGTLETLRRRLA